MHWVSWWELKAVQNYFPFLTVKVLNFLMVIHIFFFLFVSWTTSYFTEGLLLALCLGLDRSYEVPGVETENGVALCKANTLTLDLSLQPHLLVLNSLRNCFWGCFQFQFHREELWDCESEGTQPHWNHQPSVWASACYVSAIVTSSAPAWYPRDGELYLT